MQKRNGRCSICIKKSANFRKPDWDSTSRPIERRRIEGTSNGSQHGLQDREFRSPGASWREKGMLVKHLFKFSCFQACRAGCRVHGWDNRQIELDVILGDSNSEKTAITHVLIFLESFIVSSRYRSYGNRQDLSNERHWAGKIWMSFSYCARPEESRISPIMCRISQAKHSHYLRCLSNPSDEGMHRLTWRTSYIFDTRCQLKILTDRNWRTPLQRNKVHITQWTV